MLLETNNRIEAQIVFNRSFEIIVEYEDTKGEYVDPIRLLNHEKHAQETRFEDAEKIIPFFEILILRDTSASFFYRLTLDSDKDLTPTQWEKIGKCLRHELSTFEQEKFRTQGKLFFDESPLFEK